MNYSTEHGVGILGSWNESQYRNKRIRRRGSVDAVEASVSGGGGGDGGGDCWRGGGGGSCCTNPEHSERVYFVFVFVFLVLLF